MVGEWSRQQLGHVWLFANPTKKSFLPVRRCALQYAKDVSRRTDNAMEVAQKAATTYEASETDGKYGLLI